MASEKKWVLVSSRFDNGAHEALVRATAQKLKDMGLPIYIVEAGVGDRFGPKTFIGLHGMCAMLAFVSSEPPYGEKTESKYCTYHEVKTANEKGVPIVAVQMGDTYPPVTGEDYGTAQNSFVFTQDLVRIDGRRKTADDLAKMLYKPLCTIEGIREAKKADSKEATEPAKADEPGDASASSGSSVRSGSPPCRGRGLGVCRGRGLGVCGGRGLGVLPPPRGRGLALRGRGLGVCHGLAPTLDKANVDSSDDDLPPPRGRGLALRGRGRGVCHGLAPTLDRANVASSDDDSDGDAAEEAPAPADAQEAKKAAAKEAREPAKAEAPNPTAAEVPTPQRSGGPRLTPTAAPVLVLPGTAKFQAH